eukprot:8486244-Alexandrium_andersonii.AAC.1
MALLMGMEQARLRKLSCSVLFIDVTDAFYSVSRDALSRASSLSQYLDRIADAFALSQEALGRVTRGLQQSTSHILSA